MVEHVVQLLNETNFARRGVVTVGVPFNQGEVTSTSQKFVVYNADTTAPERQAQWYPQGPTYSDGSYKYGRFSFVADMDANGNKQVTISPGVTNHPVPFNINSSVIAEATNPFLLGLVVLGQTHWVNLANASIIEGGGPNDCYLRLKVFERHFQYPEIWIEIIIDVLSGMDHARLWFSFGHSYVQRGYLRTKALPHLHPYFPGPVRAPTTGGVFTRLDDLYMVINGPKSAFHYENNCIQAINKTDTLGAYYIMEPTAFPGVLNRTNRLVWGQYMSYRGVLVFADKAGATANAEYLRDIWAISMDWYPDKYPMYYAVPDYPSYISDRNDGIARLSAFRQAFERHNRRDPFQYNPWGNNPRTGGTGNQGERGYAFGTLRGWPMLRTGWPNCQGSIQFHSRSTGYRPNFLREPDGTWFNFTNYPRALFWNGVCFGTSGAGEDLMGLGAWVSEGDVPKAQAAGNEPWFGPDRQHGCFHMHMFDALTTMDPVSIDMMLQLGKTLIAMHDPNSYSPSIRSIEAERALGRGLQSMIQCYESTGDPEMLAKIAEWVKFAYVEYSSHTYGGSLPDYFRFVRTHGPGGPSSQVGNLVQEWHVRPWEEGIAVSGLEAARRCLELYNTDPVAAANATQMARELAASIVLYHHHRCVGDDDFQNIVLDQFSGPVSAWAPGSTVSNQAGATATIFQVETPNSGGGSDTINRTHGPANQGLVPFLRLYLMDCTAAFNAGNIITCGANTGRASIKNVPGFGTTATSNGEAFGAKGTPVPRSHWAVVDGPSLARERSFKPFGDNRYRILYKDFNGWQIVAHSVVFTASLENYYDPSFNESIKSTSIQIMSDNLTTSSADWGDGDIGNMCTSTAVATFLIYGTVNTLSYNRNVINKVIYIDALQPTVTAAGVFSTEVDADTAYLNIRKLTPSVTTSASTEPDIEVIAPSTIIYVRRPASTLITTRPGPTTHRVVSVDTAYLSVPTATHTPVTFGRTLSRASYKILTTDIPGVTIVEDPEPEPGTPGSNAQDPTE